MPEGRKLIFSLQRLPIWDQNGASTLLACGNVADTALLQVVHSRKILEFVCSVLIYDLSCLIHLIRELHEIGMPLGRLYLHLEEPKKFCYST